MSPSLARVANASRNHARGACDVRLAVCLRTIRLRVPERQLIALCVNAVEVTPKFKPSNL